MGPYLMRELFFIRIYLNSGENADVKKARYYLVYNDIIIMSNTFEHVRSVFKSFTWIKYDVHFTVKLTLF